VLVSSKGFASYILLIMIKHFLVNAQYTWLNSIILLVQRMLFVRLNKEKVERVLIFRTGNLGDTVCATPALTVIHENFPGVKIDILTHAGDSDLISLENLVDTSMFNEVINYFSTSKRALFRELKSKNYDLFIELPQYKARAFRQVRNQFIVFLLGIKQAFGWRFSHSTMFRKWQEKNWKFVNERDRLLDILESNGLQVGSSGFALGIGDSEVDGVKDFFKQSGLNGDAKSIGFVVGSKLPRTCWPLDNFKEVMNHFTAKDYQALIFGGPSEKREGDQLAKLPNVYNFCGVLKPLETAEAMKSCEVVVTNDTGAMHLAYAVGTPVISLFSSRDYPNKWFPPDDGKNQVFRTPDVHCSICFGRDCPNNICMQAIEPKVIIEATAKLLSIQASSR